MIKSVPGQASALEAAHSKGPPKATDCWILHERAREYHWQGAGQLSIKAFFGGRAHYRVGCGHHAVDERGYLVLNEGQTYSIHIESQQPVESFCLFFAQGFAEEVRASVSQKAERLLDQEDVVRPAPIRFFEKNYAHDQVLSPALLRLRKAYANAEREELLEALYAIMEKLLKVHEITLGEPERLENVRRSTREELYRRVSRARDYANALFAQRVTLREIARAACMSPNHLLRTFRQAFGETPHQFLTTRRLEEARQLLADRELPVTEICLAVGFESLGSFSTLFRRRFGISPTEYRRAKK